jgi:hypothetical protein
MDKKQRTEWRKRRVEYIKDRLISQKIHPEDWRAYQQGERAFDSFLYSDEEAEPSNPHVLCTDAHRAWYLGYLDAEEQHLYLTGKYLLVVIRRKYETYTQENGKQWPARPCGFRC